MADSIGNSIGKLHQSGKDASRTAQVNAAKDNLVDKQTTALNAAAKSIDETDPEILANSLIGLETDLENQGIEVEQVAEISMDK